MVAPGEGWAVGVGGTLIQCHNGMWDQQMRAAW
jgi:hypothetical protein